MGAVAEAVVKPVVKAIEEVGHAVENVGREVGQAVEKVGREVGNAAETVADVISENPAMAIAIVAAAVAAPYLAIALAEAGMAAGVAATATSQALAAGATVQAAAAAGISAAAASTTVSMATGAILGAGVGAISTIDSGKNVLEAAAMGGVTGAIASGVAPAVSGTVSKGISPVVGQTAGKVIGSAAGGAAAGAGTAAITGSDIGKAALAGGIGGGVGQGTSIAAGGGTLGNILGGVTGGTAAGLAVGKDITPALAAGLSSGINAALSSAANNLATQNKPITPAAVSEQAKVPQQVASSYVDDLTMALAEELGYEVNLQDVQSLAKPDVKNAFEVAQTKVKIYGTPETVTDFSTPLVTGEAYRVKDPNTGVVTIYDQENNVIATTTEAQQAPAPVTESEAYKSEYAPSISEQDRLLTDIIMREQAGTEPSGAGVRAGTDTTGGRYTSDDAAGNAVGYETVEPVDVEVTASRVSPSAIPEIPIPEGVEQEPVAETPTASGKAGAVSAKGSIGVISPRVVPTGVIGRVSRSSLGLVPQVGASALAQALGVAPGVAGGGGDVDPSRTGGKKKNVWNVASLKLKDALGA